MIRESALIDYLSCCQVETFSGVVYRATRMGLDPTTPSTAGGRWMPREGMAVLYTSFEREGALAEMSFHLGMLTPVPSKPISIHTLQVTSKRLIRLQRTDFAGVGIEASRFGELDYRRTEVVGDAIGFLEFDAMRVPSARWECDNLVLLADNQDISVAPTVVNTEQVDWLEWAKANGFVAN